MLQPNFTEPVLGTCRCANLRFSRFTEGGMSGFEREPSTVRAGLAKRLGADLIMLGCRGRGGIRRALGESVSDAVIRNAPCPVLVVSSNEIAQTPERAAPLQGRR